MANSSRDTYTSQLPIQLRVFYSSVFFISGVLLLIIDWQDVGLIICSAALIICGFFLLLFSTFIRIDGEEVKIGVIGIPLVKWKISNLQDFSHIELSPCTAWCCGIYLEDVDSRSWLFAAGREAITLRNALTGRRITVSAKNSRGLVERFSPR